MSILSSSRAAFKNFIMSRSKLPEAYKKSAVEYLDIYEPSEIVPSYALKDIDKLDDEGIKNVIRKGYSMERKKDLTGKLDQVLADSKNFKKQDPDRNAFEFIDQRIKTNSAAVEETHKAFVGSLENEVLKAGGKNVFRIYQLAFNNPGALKKNLGISNEDMYIALANPDYAKTPELRILGKAYRKLDQDFVKRFQSTTLLGEMSDFVASMNPNPSVAESLGVNGMRDVLVKYTKISEKNAIKVAKEYFKLLRTEGRHQAHVAFARRQLEFRGEGLENIRNQYGFYKIMTGLDDETAGVMERLLSHKEKLAQKAYFFKEFGEGPEEVINTIFQKLKEGKDVKRAKALSNYQKKAIRSLEFGMGRGYAEYSSLRYWVEAIDKFTSAIYGAPQSLLRNLDIDYTMHALSIKKAFLDSKGGVGFFADRFAKPLMFMGRNVFTREARRGLNDFLNVMDFAMTNNALFQTQGLRRENFFGDVIEIPKDMSLSEKLGMVANKGAGWMNYQIQSLTGNIAHYDATTAVNVANNALAFSELILKNMDYDSFIRATGPLGEKTLFWHFGIGRREFNALKEMFDKVSGEVPDTKIKKLLGFGGKRIILPQMLKDAPAEILEKYRKKGETIDQFREHLRISYHSFLTFQRNMAQTGLYRANRVIDKGLMRGTFVDLLLRPFAKFFNITHAQHYDGLRTGLSISLYGSPYNVGYGSTMMTKKGMAYWGRAVAYYGSGSMAVLMTKDMLNGREPRAMTKKQWALALASSGVGGIPLSIPIQSLYGGGKKGSGSFYGDAPLGSFLSDTIDLFEVFKKGDSYHIAKWIQNTTGFGKIWWARGMTDKLMRDWFLDDNSRIALEKWYATKLKSPFYGGKKDVDTY